jgi:mRNA interferase MazF
MTPISIKQWHIYVVDLEPRIGTKPGKQRPCVTIQPDEFVDGGLKSVVVLPITTRIYEEDTFPLRVRLEKGVCGLEKESDIMIDQILAWDLSLFRKDLGQLSETLTNKIKDALREFLDL